jgi:hypothetical protein
MVRQQFYKKQPIAIYFSVACSLFLLTPVLAGNDFSIEDTFKAHCIECHGAKGKVKGDVNLVSYSEGEDIKEDPELLQTVMEVIDFGRCRRRKTTRSPRMSGK